MTKQHVGDEVWRTGPNEMKQDQNKTNKDYRYHVDRFLMNLQDMRIYMQHTHIINAQFADGMIACVALWLPDFV